GVYGKILNYVMSVDTVFFAVSAACLFIFRRRDEQGGFRVPGHPVTTALFAAACAAIVAATVYNAPKNSAIGLAIMLAGIPVYLLWSRSARARARTS
ncbi:MAG TPA: hypothetical protein VJT67_06090, partial [Longimicrobiaceae bacterium]|nr:hypothetical protein [Longimicrobiaceae bacterium]